MNPDFVALLSELNATEARYLIVGAYALAWYGCPRGTGDLDIWVEASPANADRIMPALSAFGAPLEDIRASDFARPGVVFQIGLPPVRIDILTVLTALEFAEAWERREPGGFDGLAVAFLGRDDFIRNKLAVGRPQDLADVARLAAGDSQRG